jgi:hypothetical protein
LGLVRTLLVMNFSQIEVIVSGFFEARCNSVLCNHRGVVLRYIHYKSLSTTLMADLDF